jgi:hypothetical protein
MDISWSREREKERKIKRERIHNKLERESMTKIPTVYRGTAKKQREREREREEDCDMQCGVIEAYLLLQKASQGFYGPSKHVQFCVESRYDSLNDLHIKGLGF